MTSKRSTFKVGRTALLLAVLAPGCHGARGTRAAQPAAEPAAAPDSRLTAEQRRADFEQLWTFVDTTYPFFETKATDWAAVKAEFAPRARAAKSELGFLHVLEATLDQLYDPHCMLGVNAGDSWRPVPGEVWLEERDGGVIVTAVERESNAAAAGVEVGQEVVSIDGRAPESAIALRYPETLPPGVPDARAWALLSAAAGRHARPHQLEVVEATGEQRTLRWKSGGRSRPTVEARQLRPEVGYIAVSTFADEAVVDAFDEALERFRDAEGLIIDVRSNRGGDTMYAVPMMGRFVAEERPYARMTRRNDESWAESVSPRGPWTFRGEVVVLVDRFSISMAEGFAMGLHGMDRARIVGTRMAGLGAAIARVELEHSSIPVQISAEPVFHVDGTPRWELAPDVEVDVVARRRAGVRDPILEAGLAELDRLQEQ